MDDKQARYLVTLFHGDGTSTCETFQPSYSSYGDALGAARDHVGTTEEGDVLPRSAHVHRLHDGSSGRRGAARTLVALYHGRTP